jgi:hypothetical protein
LPPAQIPTRAEKYKSGSTALTLAQHNTGRAGTGSAETKAEQSEILRLLGLP